jgi:hypothetical protein
MRSGKLGAAEFAIESVTLYGKLRKLTDISRVEDQDDIWGELLEDNGDKWRIKFHPADFDKARKLFTKQVVVFGDASYFKTKCPRIDVKEITEERKRDYVAAFDARLMRCYPVSARVNQVQNDDAECAKAVERQGPQQARLFS